MFGAGWDSTLHTHTHRHTPISPPLINNSLLSARSPTIELNSDTVYLEISQVEGSVP